MLEIGSLIDGKYKILNKVGQGGMSIVYLAMNEKANKQWAIKEVRKDGVKDFEVIKQGLVVETDLLKKLNHPNLPSIVDVIEGEDTFLIVMDYIQGNPLSKTLEEYGAQSQEYVIEWAKQLCDVLGYLHSRKPPIIYRDMKPSNVMLKPDGNVTLIDFGTAREYKEKNIADTTCLGTIGYAAPEQFGGMGQTDARTDIYCLGATLYHLVTGKNPSEPPYEIKPIRQINPALSNGLEKIILKCTQRDPNDRYQNCAELMYALEHYEEIDDKNKRKAIRRVATFAVSVLLTAALGVTSLWANGKLTEINNNDYEMMLSTAKKNDDYKNAILLNTARTEAYEQFADFLAEDNLTEEDIVELKSLENMDNPKSAGGITYALNELKEKNPDGYIEVCYRFGLTLVKNLDSTVLNKTNNNDAYKEAYEWFAKIPDEYINEKTGERMFAKIFCEFVDSMEISKDSGLFNESTDSDKLVEYGEVFEKMESFISSLDSSSVYSKSTIYNDLKKSSKEDPNSFMYGFKLEVAKAYNNLLSENKGSPGDSKEYVVGFYTLFDNKMQSDGNQKNADDIMNLMFNMHKMVRETNSSNKDNVCSSIEDTVNKYMKDIMKNDTLRSAVENTDEYKDYQKYLSEHSVSETAK